LFATSFLGSAAVEAKAAAKKSDHEETEEHNTEESCKQMCTQMLLKMGASDQDITRFMNKWWEPVVHRYVKDFQNGKCFETLERKLRILAMYDNVIVSEKKKPQ
jgi:hypothetical protein